MKLKSSTIRTTLGLLLILIGLFLPQIQEWIPDLIPDTPAPAVVIEEPTQEIKDKWKLVMDDPHTLNSIYQE